MYSPDVEELEDVVILDHEVIFDQITNAVVNCLPFELSVGFATEQQFRQTGMFTEKELRRTSSKVKDQLAPKYI